MMTGAEQVTTQAAAFSWISLAEIEAPPVSVFEALNAGVAEGHAKTGTTDDLARGCRV